MGLVKFWVMALIFKTRFTAEEYSYDEEASKEKTSTDGIRLVGAARSDTAKYPFVVGFSTKASDKGERASCTGSVVSKDWILSAAHCITSLIDTKDLKICTEVSTQGGLFINKKNQSIQCVITENEDIKIYPINPIAKAYMMMNEIENKVSEESGEKIQIEYFVRHKNSYRGGGTYGTYGGYDITMAKLVSPTNVEPACIPTSDFKDSSLGSGYDNIQNVQLAGYGKYYREPCQTDELGPSANHYCESNSKCDTSKNPPISPECKEFLSNNPAVEKEFSSKNLHKITVKAQGGKPVDCFRKTSYLEGSEGWCLVTDDATQIGELSQTSSWGFCSRDCFLKNVENIEPDTNVFRSKENVDILDDELCNKFLQASYDGINPEYVPEVLCIGYYKKSNTKIYSTAPGSKAVAGTDETHRYVTSAGTCKGDSGGPVFVKDEKTGKFIVLGAVSGGRGRLGECGGINNPTHYARIKALAGWIKNVMGPDVKDLCEIGNPTGVEATVSNAIVTKPQASLTSRNAQNTAAVPLTNLGSTLGGRPVSYTQQRSKLTRRGKHNLATTHNRLPTGRKSLEPLRTIQDEYSYDEEASKEKSNGDGIRLVGAARADTAKYPFVIGFTLSARENHDFSECTGSVISKDWVLSAAHCILALVDTKDLNKCAEQTANGQFHTNKMRRQVKCSITESGDIKIYPVVPQAEAYIGINDVNDRASVAQGEKIRIEYIVRHRNSYRGGGNYGTFGGYDITLLKLVSPTNVLPACLPAPSFQDSGLGPGFDNIQNVMLAGYGRYYREPCQTDELGPSPNHYCAKNSKCNTEENPPVSATCNKFLTNNPEVQQEFSDKNLHKITLNIQGKDPVDCFRKTSYQEGSKGWCQVSDDASTIGEITGTSSWGFCSKDCFLKNTEYVEPDSSVFRSKENVDILNDELCNKFLLASYGGINPEYVPEVLCIGFYKKSNVKTYSISPGGKPLAGKDESYPYVTSAGTCNGDSGGPVFVKDAKSDRYVVLGAVSGGRGRLGKCGGMNNPTHYARVNKLTDWVKEVMGPDSKEVCEVEGDKPTASQPGRQAAPIAREAAPLAQQAAPLAQQAAPLAQQAAPLGYQAAPLARQAASQATAPTLQAAPQRALNAAKLSAGVPKRASLGGKLRPRPTSAKAANYFEKLQDEIRQAVRKQKAKGRARRASPIIEYI